MEQLSSKCLCTIMFSNLMHLRGKKVIKMTKWLIRMFLSKVFTNTCFLIQSEKIIRKNPEIAVVINGILFLQRATYTHKWKHCQSRYTSCNNTWQFNAFTNETDCVTHESISIKNILFTNPYFLMQSPNHFDQKKNS